MIALLSPAKSLDFASDTPQLIGTTPIFEKEASTINNVLRKKSVEELMQLMKLSENLAQLNHDRYQQFDPSDDSLEKRSAIFAFNGDVYKGFDAYSLDNATLNYAQDHIRILSGFYGVLKPLDLIQPYRLEMGTRIGVGEAKNLYALWKDKLTEALNKEIEERQVEFVVNLASKEYAKAVDLKSLNAKVLEIEFKELRNGQMKVISFNAKKARGLMGRMICEKQISSLPELLKCNIGDYVYEKNSSTEERLLFLKK